MIAASRMVAFLWLPFWALQLVRVKASPRPEVSCAPHNLAQPLPLPSLERTQTCTIPASRNGTDDSGAVLSALHQCNNGGTVVFKPDTTYVIGKPLNLSFLQHVDLEIQGTIQFTADTDYWQANSFKYAYQNSSTFLAIGGTDVNIYGGGLIDGQGQVWWTLAAKNSSTERPILWNIDGLSGGTMSNIRMVDPPNWFNWIQNSENFVYTNLDLQVSNLSAPNTDGWDTYRSSNVVIQDSEINNTDDCVFFKPNSTQILVQNLACNGSHGISVGSLAQYVGETDIVSDVYVYNISMSDASDMARIKVWPGAAPNVTDAPDVTDAGGGSGYVKNVTYDTAVVENVQWAIEITACYETSATLCAEYPSTFLIEDVSFKNFLGVTSAKEEPDVATVVCVSEDVSAKLLTTMHQFVHLLI